MSWLGWAALALSWCLMVAISLVAYRTGLEHGRTERCSRHSHAEKLAAGRLAPPMHNGPPARVSTADLARPQRIHDEPEGDEPVY